MKIDINREIKQCDVMLDMIAQIEEKGYLFRETKIPVSLGEWGNIQEGLQWTDARMDRYCVKTELLEGTG